jgi:formylglycine-generating enzyme
MKKTLLFLLTLAIFLAACGGEETQPGATQQSPTAAPPAANPTNTAPATQPIVSATEIIPVKLEPQEGDTRTYVDGTSLVYIPAGEFSMGVKDGEDNPIHTAYTDGFWIYTTEVTNAQYDLCVSLGQCAPPDDEINPSASRIDSLPVTGVQHEQAQGYCEWIRGRLPTEAEWEKAARGKDAVPYPWGDEEPTCDKSNFSDCQKLGPDTVIAREAGRSPYQLFDMAGNVFEWVQDWYDPEAYTKGVILDEHKVIRGGAYHSSADEILTFNRFFELPETAREDLGFRCVVENENVLGSETVQATAPMCEMGVVVAPQPETEDCFVDLKVTGAYCSNGKPYANVKMDTNDGIFAGYFFYANPGDCDIGNPFVCTGPELSSFIVKAVRTCKVENVGVTECPNGYESQNNMCVLVGSNEPGVCPDGFNTDPEKQCCSVVVAPEPACPPGYKYEAPHCTLQVQDSVTVNLLSCSIADKPTPTPKPGDDPEPEPTPTCDPATGAGCTVAPSDSRLKTDIIRVGETGSGLPLYTFRYIGGTTVYRGVMAQDVLKVMPEAVILMPNGYWAVNYAMLGLVMEPVE